MNEHDSARIRLILKEIGFDPADEPDGADLLLYNTCTIREKAHHKAMSEIGRAKIFKEGRPGTIVGVCGCVAQQDRDSLFERHPHIDMIFGPDQIALLPNLIRRVEEEGRATALDIIDDPERYAFLDKVPEKGTITGSSFVSIMKGCNCSCSYCIVPSVRGREVCRAPEDILSEVQKLVSSGAKEVVLLGQNVNAYNSTRSCSDTKGVSFAGLIRMISEQTSIERIRFTSPHPKDVGGDLIREYAENIKLCPHIHLPIQAGSNEILRRMRRGYTRERYMEIVRDLRKARDGISITTDIIVGFCGETEYDFDDTYDLMERVSFDSIFAFKYSPRPQTKAAEEFEDDVPDKEKKRRLEKILELQRTISRSHNEALIGIKDEALVYGLDRMKRGLLTGRLPDNRIIHFAGNSRLIGDIVPVRITGANKNSLAGEMVL